MKALFFHPDEYPLNTLPEIMHKTANRVYLKIITQDGPLYLNADYREYSNNDFHLGSGLSSYPKPPSFFLYPYRIPGLICIIGGILFYILLPCRARAANVLRYDRWRIMLGDFLAALFCAVPLVLPILIVGGTVQAITNGWPLFIFFCPLFICGIFLLWVAAWWGSYQIALLDQGIEVSSFAGKRFYAFGDMAHFQPVIFKGSPLADLYLVGSGLCLHEFIRSGSCGTGAHSQLRLYGQHRYRPQDRGDALCHGDGPDG